ncbi:MAG: methionyl-tRNA formyltransferase [bacterium]|nr:methionyl-tRNA formyltransferase [bacterium]
MFHVPFSFVFFGTPEPAVEILDALFAKGYTPALIVTAPDKPQGRKLVVTPPPVKVWALAHHIPVLQPEKLDSSFFLELSASSFELFIVVAYGSLIPKEILALPKHGSLNVHYSLLPKYRGASPIEHQILEDDKEVGVSLLLLDEEMDHGPIVAEEKIQDSRPNATGGQAGFKIQEWPPTAPELRKISNQVAGELLVNILPDWVSGKIEAKAQDHSKATYTRKFKKTDGELDLSADPYKNLLKIKAFDGSIGTYFFVETSGKKIRVTIKDAKMEGDALVITRVVPEGKKEMDYTEFTRGVKTIS